MPKSTTALATPLREQLDRLAALEPTSWPVLSLYLNLRADQQGQEQYEPFLRKTFAERRRSLKGETRKSFERDAERFREYLAALPPSTNGVAIFACAACDGFFDAVPLEVPVEHHSLFIGSVPHLLPAREAAGRGAPDCRDRFDAVAPNWATSSSGARTRTVRASASSKTPHCWRTSAASARCSGSGFEDMNDAARERQARARQPVGPAPRRRTGTQPSLKRARRSRVTTAP